MRINYKAKIITNFAYDFLLLNAPSIPTWGTVGQKIYTFFSSFYNAACIHYVFFNLVTFFTIECVFVHHVFIVR